MNSTRVNNENYYGDENENVDNTNDSPLVKNILLFKNGDQYFPGKRIVVNKRYTPNWDCFLEDLTRTLNPRNGAIRDIRTPYHGTRIRSLEDLSTNGKYVALSKGESLKIIDYDKVFNVNSQSHHVKSNLRLLKPLRLVNRDVEKIESRYTQNLYVKSSIIYVFKNGDRFTPAIKVVIKSQEHKHMNVLVKAIEDRVLLQTNKPIRRLYTLNGDLIKYAKDVENGKYYVAASNEPFENIEYGQVLPVIRGGRVPSKRNQIKFLNQMPSPKSDKRSPASSNEEPSNRSTQLIEPAGVNPKTTEKRQQKVNQKQKSEKEIAAIKIQAAFRGFQTRKEIAKAKENNEPVSKKKIFHIPKKTKSKNPEKESSEQERPTRVNYSKVKKVEKETQEKKPQNKPKNVETKENQRKQVPNKSNSDDERNKAAAKIQAGFRGYLTRQRLKYRPNKTKPSTKSQIPNKTQSKQSQPRKVSDDNVKEKAAIKIQAGFRGFHTRQILKTKIPLKAKEPLKQTEKKQETKSVNETKDTNNDSREKAAIVIQAGFRGYKTRNSMKVRNRAAQTIQAGFRGFKTRKVLKQNSQQKSHENPSNEIHDNNKEEATKRIQAGYRGFKIRKEIKNKERENQENAAIKIQAGYRGFRTRKEIKNKERENQENAAIKIQAGYRGYKTRKEFLIKEKSAERIQAGFRSYKTRKELSNHSVKKPKYLTPEEQAQERNEAAAKIQAAFRGHVYRREHS